MDHKEVVVSHTASEQRRTDALLLLAQARAEGRSPELCSISRVSPAGSSASSDPSADFNRSILDASVDCIKVLNLDGTLHSMNEKGRCLMEIDDFERIKHRFWIEFWSHEQRPVVQQAINAARAGDVGRFTGYRATAKGTPKWWDVIISPMRNASGATTHLVVISRDVTTARDHSESGDLLNLELGHRIKNLFALVNGLITVAARPNPAVQPFAETLRERFSALSRALDYVIPSQEVTTPAPASTLQGLLRVLLDPYEAIGQSQRRFVILGDDPPVGPKATTSVALSVHELATNAVKYGALSSPGGHVTITCRSNADGECELSWTERGGPEVLAKPERTGFGSKLILRSVTGALEGKVTKRWDRKGLTLCLLLPLTPLSH